MSATCEGVLIRVPLGTGETRTRGSKLSNPKNKDRKFHYGNYSDYDLELKSRRGDSVQPTRLKHKKLN